MDRPLDLLTQSELLALAVEATRRGDSAHSMAYLKSAAERGDASAEALFLLGSEYAQVGLIGDARGCLERAVGLAPDYAIARFQLGLLYLTSGQPEPALETWAPLDRLEASHPQAAYLGAFHRGLRHLVKDEFPSAAQHLAQGIELNQDNPALNANMQRMLDEVRGLIARTPAIAEGSAADADADEEPASHLLINAYTGGKPH